MSKFIVTSILLLFAMTKAYAADMDISCNPNENCVINGPPLPCPTMGEPFRTCGSRVTEPVCESRRLACRVKCGRLNDDANKHQKEDYGRIAALDITIKNNNARLESLGLLIRDNENLFSSQSNICASIYQARNGYLDNISIQKTFVTQLAVLAELNLSDEELMIKIDKEPFYSSAVKLILTNFIKSSTGFKKDLKTLVEEYNSENTEAFTQVMVQSLNFATIECDSVTTKIGNQKSGLENQKATLIEEQRRLSAERLANENHIKEQERRKCR